MWRERWWLLGLIGLATCTRIPTIDGWDDAFYLGQLLSVVQDRDLRLQDDVVLVPRLLEEKHRILTTILPPGALANTFSIGPAVLLAPLVGPVVGQAPPPPWRAIRTAAAIAAMLMLGFTALLCTAVVRRCGVPPDVAELAVGLAILCGPLAVYGTRAYLNGHLAGALLVALAAQQGTSWLESRHARHAVGLGLAVGLACVNRWQDAVIVGPLAIAVVARSLASARATASGLALVASTALLSVAIQPLAWQVQFGRSFWIPQGPGYMRWLEPNFIPLIFSSYHGLVPWTPGLALGLLMLPIAMARRRSLRGWPSALPVAFTVGTGLAIYVSACPEDWWGGASFSARRLTSLTAPAAVGLGLLLWRLSARMKRLVAGLVGSWAVVAVSAHLSRFEDLGLLLVGRPGPFQPPGIAAVAPPAWASAWGALHFAVPGFSLSDAPRWWDRVVGILIVVGVVVSLRLTWAMLQGRPRLQTAVALLAVIYVLSWSVFLTLCPSNTRWNVTWREFLERPLDPSRSRLLSPDMGVARDVVTAFRAAREHDTASLEAAIARLREAGLDVTEADVRRAARDPRTP